MSAISTYLEYIRSKIYAKDVRTAIVNAISQCYDDVNKPALQAEAMQAAVQAKIDAGEMAALTIADGSLTGAKLANGTIQTAKIADGAITANKIKSKTITADKLSDDAKVALLECFEHVTWGDEHGAEYVKALGTALMIYPMLSASFDPGNIKIYDDCTLDYIKQFLSVRYYESSGVSYDVTEYDLSGELNSAKSQITVTYANMSKSITIDVIVGRPLVLSDIASHIGYSDFAIDANGSISFSSAKAYSIISLNPSIKHIRFTPSHTHEDRLDVSARVASANLGNGQYVCTDTTHIYVFTQNGDSYTAQSDTTQATIEVKNWSGHDTDIRRRDVTLSNGVLKIVDANNPEVYKTVTNAGIIGFWDNNSSKYKPQLVRVYNN